MSVPTSPEDAAVGPPEHLHPLFLLTGLGRSLRGMAGASAAIGYLAVSGKLGSALFSVGVLLALMAAGIVILWWRFEYRVGANEIRIDSGIFNRIHRSIPFDRIQDVDITQGPLARVLGLARVEFETGASGGKEEGALHAISLVRAEQLRDLVRARRAGSAPADLEGASATPIYRMGFKRLLLAGVFNFSLAVFAGLFGLTQTVGDVAGFDPFDPGFWTKLLSVGDPVRDLILAHRLTAALAGLVVLVTVGILTGIVRTVLTDFDFRVDRTGIGLRRRRGLLTKTDVPLPVSRAQAAVVLAGPITDWLRWRELRVQSLAKDEKSRGSHVLAPLARDEEVDRILHEMGWNPVPGAHGWTRVSPEFVIVLAVALSPLLLIAVGNFFFEPIVGIPFLALVAGAIGMRWLAWRRTGYVVDGDRILIRTGWWKRRMILLPARKIQSVDLRENFITRAFGIAWLHFGVAGGGMTGHSIPAIPRREARKLRDLLLEMGS